MNSFYLDDWHVDVTVNRLSRGSTETRIEAKTMEVLVYLASHPGEIVAREQLERDVWAGRVVGYDSLTSSITKLRKALNDDSRQPRFIETVSKKGYRLIAPVSADSQEILPATKSPRRSRLAMTGLAVTAAIVILAAMLLPGLYSTGTARKADTDPGAASIAILPFSDLSENAAHSYLSEGITEDITTALSKLSGLFVIARSSTMEYQNQSVDLKYAAGRLNVRYVLDGSVRRSGSKLRVDAKLIDGDSGILLWGEHYDRQIKDIFDVQDDITLNIVNALSVKLTEEEKHRTARKYTVSINAYDEFLKGQRLYAHHTREDNQWARESFLKSINMDPGFARAFSALALTYVAEFRYSWNADPRTVLAQAAELAQKAISIDDELPNAYWALGYVYLYQKKYEQSIDQIDKAIALNPNYADGYATLGISYIYAGHPEQGAQMMHKAMRLNPQYPASYVSALGQAYYFLHNYEDALPLLREAVERNMYLRAPHVYLISSLSQLGKKDEASWAAAQLRMLDPEFSVDAITDLFPIKDRKHAREIKQHLRGAGL